jgi:hypothetical protein
MLKAYAALAMPKKAKWKRLSGTLDSLIYSCQKKAQEFEAEPKTAGQDGDFGAAFGSAFPAINEFTCDKRFDSPRDAYFRESSCFLLLSCLIARRHSSSAGVEIALNKKTREQVFSPCVHIQFTVLKNFTYQFVVLCHSLAIKAIFRPKNTKSSNASPGDKTRESATMQS